MNTTEKLIEATKETLKSLEDDLASRTSGISSNYKATVGAAMKAYKESLEVIEKTKKDSLALAEKELKEATLIYKKDEANIAKVKEALKALIGNTPKPVKTKVEKTNVEKTEKPVKTGFVVPHTLAEAISVNQKVYFAIYELGSGLIPDIEAKVNSYGEVLITKKISNAVNALKNDMGLVTTDGKEGKAFKYKIA